MNKNNSLKNNNQSDRVYHFNNNYPSQTYLRNKSYQPDKYFRAVVKYGHQGRRESYPIARYVAAKNLMDAMDAAKNFGGCKRNLPDYIIEAKPVSANEYWENYDPNSNFKKKLTNYGDLYLDKKIAERNQTITIF